MKQFLYFYQLNAILIQICIIPRAGPDQVHEYTEKVVTLDMRSPWSHVLITDNVL